MLKYYSYNVVFREVPDEVTLAINISGCPNNCSGCHSPYLKEDVGEPLNYNVISALINRYRNAITCICFMGGDSNPEAVGFLAETIKEITGRQIKTAWYSGRSHLPHNSMTVNFDFIKLGPYIEVLGGLDSPSTNQRFFKVVNGALTDITCSFQKKMTYFSNK